MLAEGLAHPSRVPIGGKRLVQEEGIGDREGEHENHCLRLERRMIDAEQEADHEERSHHDAQRPKVAPGPLSRRRDRHSLCGSPLGFPRVEPGQVEPPEAQAGDEESNRRLTISRSLLAASPSEG